MSNASAHSPMWTSSCTVEGLEARYQPGEWFRKSGTCLRILYASLFERRWFILHNHGRNPLLSDSSFRFLCNSSTTERWQTRTLESCNLLVNFNLGYLKPSLCHFSAKSSNQKKIHTSIKVTFLIQSPRRFGLMSPEPQLAKGFLTSRPKR